MATTDGPAWIDSLVDGEPLDWPALARAFGSDSPALARMRRMAVLCAALTAAHPQRAAALADDGNTFRWGHLRALARIGEGSSGEVYRAFDTVLEREVALKLINRAALQGRAFLAEARRLAQVRHPNVLAVHGAAIHDGRAGLWADLIAGRSLRVWIEDVGPQPIARVLAIASALASALAAVHAAGLVHGDIKPANIMREDGDGRIVLMDFGSAGTSTEAGLHSLLGSPLTMAPEQFRGEPITAKADLYGLGVTLFYLLAGRLPITATSVSELSRAHQDDAARQAVKQLPGLPRTLVRLLADLLDREPAQRPDAETVVARLQRILTAPQRRRRRLALTAIVGSLGIGLVLALVGWDSARQAERQALAERNRAEAANAFLVEVMAAPQATREGEQVRVVDLLDQSVARLQAGLLADQPEVEADLWQTIGRSFGALNRHQPARDALQRSLTARQRLHGPDDPRTLEAERLLMSEPEPGLDPSEALERWRDLHRRASAATDPEHPLPALISTAIGYRLLLLGRVDEAHGWIEPVFLRRTQVRWQHPLDRSAVEIHRLQLLQRLGDVDAMLEAARETRRWIEHHAGERHANALLARNIEIGALLQRGRLTEAEQESQATYELSLDWLGEDNALTAAALGSWASALSEQGRVREALPLHERRHALTRKRLGEEAPSTLSAALNLANALRDQREWMRAETIYHQILARLPERNDIALLARGNLAELYLDQQQYRRAGSVASDAVELLEQSLGSGHLFTHYARAMHAAALRGQGQTQQAVSQLEAATADIERLLGPEHPLTLKTRFHLGLALIDAGRNDDARTVLDDVVARRSSRLGDDHAQTRLAAEALAGIGR